MQAALGWTGVASESARTQIAPCLLCGAELRFAFGEYGQTLEICTNGRCMNRTPHKPQPDLSSNARKRWERL